ncbi:GCN5-related N-acetyltransferase [Gluconacetobacter diazotrophicus PA1 5]|uniref:Uncharacterized protein n=2 Tax=Gluconacetobacter diazotrophicus TaxID=33996 RepID=A9H7E1_GLUDA|nr:GNAT family N-acetyltransferase [Gluconacetobacter diazotrophicus]ACI52313.1 GCN5-related N-acetyltransferase [Gluconacetobacter diazotrophicus PA1 5]MBB2156864.1 GNAT family N-acetyltransferase [Gluconacetobacter diazotrophicus]TWB04792.1 acetyltransferase (GNAT) family protein [Gluconacetobacter diazotrophicus]CAP57627.1 hypothetical protein GDI3684 [Gluconacetobacter diazotrophicus PA1 5]
MTAYRVEPWARVLPELQALWEGHWREVGRDHDAMPLSPDLAKYAAIDAQDCLHVVTMRCDGRLVGYVVAIIQTHLHYQTVLHAVLDLYYVVPEARRWMAGPALLRAAERTLAARGVRRVVAGTKLHHAPDGRPLDNGAILRRLGWAPFETLYERWIAP